MADISAEHRLSEHETFTVDIHVDETAYPDALDQAAVVARRTVRDLYRDALAVEAGTTEADTKP